MKRTKSTIGILAVTLVACAGLSVACSSSDSTPPGGNAGAGGNGTAGNAGRGGSSAAAGSSAAGSAAGGSAGMSGGVAGSAGTGGAPNNCTRLPMNWLLTDFSPATIKGVSEGSSWDTGHDTLWGSSTSLTGGDVFYRGKPESAAKVTLHGETLTVTATIAPGDYTGYMFNFGPKCTNASSTQGLQFDVSTDSTLGDATLKVQMQQRSDYPSTANPSRPGDCMPSSPDTQYSDCLSPATTVVSSGTTLTPGTVALPWTNFAGGKPVDALNNTELMAIQWQFECPSTGGKAPPVSADVVTNAGSGGISGGGSGGADPAGNGGVSSGGSAGASAGSSGDSGSGGSAGSAAGSSGSGGSGGSSGSEAGSSGTAGSSGSGGAGGSSAGSGGAAGSAGSGGGNSTPLPCVVSFTIDNVKFY